MSAKAQKRTLTGRVIADRMQSTVTVLVERRIKHPRYGKYIRRSTKLHAHDAENQYQVGDWVHLVACRPLSKTKFWRVVGKVNG